MRRGKARNSGAVTPKPELSAGLFGRSVARTVHRPDLHVANELDRRHIRRSARMAARRQAGPVGHLHDIAVVEWASNERGLGATDVNKRITVAVVRGLKLDLSDDACRIGEKPGRLEHQTTDLWRLAVVGARFGGVVVENTYFVPSCPSRWIVIKFDYGCKTIILRRLLNNCDRSSGRYYGY